MLLVVVLALAAALTGCAGSTHRGAAPERGYPPAQAALAALRGQVLAKGPHGEQPASVADLTDAEVAQVKEMGATAAIVMHYGGNDWANAQIAGLTAAFRGAGDRHRRNHRRELRPGPAGLGHRDRDGEEPGHHRVHPDRPGRDLGCVQGRCGRRREARLHGQRPGRPRGRQGLRVGGLGRQLRQRRGLGAPDGEGARRRRARSASSTTRPTSSSRPSATRASRTPSSPTTRTSRSSTSAGSPVRTSPGTPSPSPTRG